VFRFESKPNKEFVECLGPGPHVTKNGSRWLVVGFHIYITLEDGTVRCQKCAERTSRVRIIRDPYIPSYVPKLTEQESRLLGERLQSLKETFEKYEGRKQVLLKDKEKKKERQTKF